MVVKLWHRHVSHTDTAASHKTEQGKAYACHLPPDTRRLQIILPMYCMMHCKTLTDPRAHTLLHTMLSDTTQPHGNNHRTNVNNGHALTVIEDNAR
jgi:hypothetical protein